MVTGLVKQRTDDRQVPWTNSSQSKVVRLVPGPGSGRVGVRPPATAPVESPQSVESGLALERSEKRLIQWGLKAVGHDPGAIDGLIGPGTRAALRRWQESRGEKQTGYLDAVSARLLLAAGRERKGREAPRRTEAEAERRRREREAAETLRTQAEEKARREAEARYRRPFGPKWIVAGNQPCQVYNPGMEPGDKFSFTWSGACYDGKVAGVGRLVWQFNDVTGVYEGRMRDGRLNGRGVMSVDDGSRYEGEYRNGKRTGRGIYIWADGGRYEGQWRNGKRTGRGTSIWATGGRYEGQWRNGKRHGRGTTSGPTAAAG